MGSESSKLKDSVSSPQPEDESQPSLLGPHTEQQPQSEPAPSAPRLQNLPLNSANTNANVPVVKQMKLQRPMGGVQRNFNMRMMMQTQDEPESELKADDAVVNAPGVRPGNEGMLLEFILDESGSMGIVRDSTIKAFNDYLGGQKKEKADKCLVSLTKFDAPKIIEVYSYRAIEDAPLLDHETYKPNGGTNLLDAIGQTIVRTDNYLRGLGSDEEAAAKRPAVLVVVLTDGEENSSRAYSRAAIKKMVENRQSVGWTFVFLGANIDAWGEAESMGICSKNAYNFSVHNQDDLMQRMSKNTSAHRQKVMSSKATGRTYMQTHEEAFFDAEDRATEQAQTSSAAGGGGRGWFGSLGK